MIYSIGFDSKQLAKVGLEADKTLEGQELSFDGDVLTTFSTLHSYEGIEEVSREENVLFPGDTIIVSWETPLSLLEKIRRQKIKLMVVETDHHRILGLLTYATQ